MHYIVFIFRKSYLCISNNFINVDQHIHFVWPRKINNCSKHYICIRFFMTKTNFTWLGLIHTLFIGGKYYLTVITELQCITNYIYTHKYIEPFCYLLLGLVYLFDVFPKDNKIKWISRCFTYFIVGHKK